MKTTKLAIMYDFDKTLSPKDMQEFSFIPSLGIEPAQFWSEVTALAESQKMDGILTYMYMMLNTANLTGQPIRRSDFVALGKNVKLYPGVEKWFRRINEYGRQHNIEIEHFIISSGLTEIIEGTTIAGEFKKIYACKYCYNASGVAVWPATVVNYTTKTQYIFRINKGVLDENNDNDLNRYTPDQLRDIPFTNMIYIGDGLTDVPCMKLVTVNGGKSIAVYGKDSEKKKATAQQLIADHRADFIAPADYSENRELDKIVKSIIDYTEARIQMERLMKKEQPKEK